MPDQTYAEKRVAERSASAKSYLSAWAADPGSWPGAEEWALVASACLALSAFQIQLSADQNYGEDMGAVMTPLCEAAVALTSRTIRDSPATAAAISQIISSRRYSPSSFEEMTSLDVSRVANCKVDVPPPPVDSGDAFSAADFMQDSGTAVSVTIKKQVNLKRLYERTLYPIESYYRREMQSQGRILGVVEALGGSSELERRGQAAVITISGVESRKVYEDLTEGLIEAEFGVAVLRDDGLYVSSLYEVDGKTVSGVYRDSTRRGKTPFPWKGNQ